MILKRLNNFIKKLDDRNLIWIGAIVVAIIMAPILILGEGAVFPLHDQLDETILSYVFKARYWNDNVYESMMCGAVTASGLKASAPLFTLLYVYFTPFKAFVLQYFFVIMTAWFGTYLCVTLITKSSISAVLAASVFSLLPFRSIYGNVLSGIPLLLFCMLTIHSIENNRIKTVLCYIGLAYYSLTTNLVLVGYAILSIIAVIFVANLIIKKKFDAKLFFPALLMTILYMAVNYDLVLQVFNADAVSSHREEFLITGTPILEGLRDYLWEGVSHNESFHKYIYIVIMVALPIAIHNLKNKEKTARFYFYLIGAIILIAVLAAFLGSETVGKWQNSQTGMLRSFQMQRFFYILPGLWYILLGVSMSEILSLTIRGNRRYIINIVVAALVYLPTLNYVAKNPECIFYQNVNQINNSDITGYITWKQFYAEDLMNQIENDIGKGKSTYRVGSIGISPAVSLMHGFYTIDGYSNNYSLEYKHRFKKIIENELVKNEYLEAYFDNWGSRCYLFYHEWGNYYLMGKTSEAVISDFSFDVNEMKKLNCEYLFSAGKIENAEKLGLNLFGVYESESSYWRIWVYELQ